MENKGMMVSTGSGAEEQGVEDNKPTRKPGGGVQCYYLLSLFNSASLLEYGTQTLIKVNKIHVKTLLSL